MPNFKDVERKAAEAAARLGVPRPMRRGAVGERFMKCGKAQCVCHSDPGARHGPYYTLTRGVGGMTQSKYLTAEQAATARRQVAAGQEFRGQVDTFWEACEQWADADLDAAGTIAPHAVKRGASKRPSPTKSSEKSNR
jgi:hypothetical protein